MGSGAINPQLDMHEKLPCFECAFKTNVLDLFLGLDHLMKIVSNLIQLWHPDAQVTRTWKLLCVHKSNNKSEL